MSKRKNRSRKGKTAIELNIGPVSRMRSRESLAALQMQAQQEAARLAKERLAEQEAAPPKPSWFLRREALYAHLPKWMQPREEPDERLTQCWDCGHVETTTGIRPCTQCGAAVEVLEEARR